MSMTPPECWAARVCFTIAALLLLGKIGISIISPDFTVREWVIIAFVSFGIIGAGWVWSLRWVEKRELQQLFGVLIPDNKPTPPNCCGTIPPNAIALFFGNSVSYTSAFPHTVIEVGKTQLLVINKDKDKITISANFFSKDGKIVAELKDNKFQVNPNNYFRIERPNYHILIVFDQENNQAINVEYINPSVIKLLGKFYLPNKPPIIINEESQNFGGMDLSNICFGESIVDIHIE